MKIKTKIIVVSALVVAIVVIASISVYIIVSQGKNNIDAWWISISTFGVLVVTLLLLTFMGDALRDALDPRKAPS